MINRLIYFLCIYFCITFSTWVCPQALAQGGEGTLVHLDKPYYVAGETVNYKIYFPGIFNKRKPILELLVYNSEGVMVHKSYLKRDEGNFVHGYYRIPFEADQGIYNLVVGSFIEKTKKNIKIAQIPLAIYNDTNPEYKADKHNTWDYSFSTELDNELIVSIQLEKPQYHPREKINMAIVVKDHQGRPVSANTSLSVTDIGIIGSSESYPYTSIYKTELVLEPSLYLSEYIPVTGKLENQKDGQLLTFFMPSSNMIYYTTSEYGGNFQLPLPDFYEQTTLQYIGEFSEGTPISLQGNITSSNTAYELVSSASVVNYIQESQKRKLIYQLFNKVEGSYKYSIPESAVVSAPDREYKAGDYPFEDIPRFCKEISSTLKYVKDNKGGFEFKMFNPESRKFFFGTPLFIVDGQMTKNKEFLTDLDFQKIDRISLYYDNRVLSNNFGFAGFSGVVIIHSKEKNFKVPQAPSTQEFHIYGLQPVIATGTELVDIPDSEPIFKPQLLWEPTLQTNSDGHLELSYRQSDDISKFQIEVVAQAKDGRRGHGKLEYRIID